MAIRFENWDNDTIASIELAMDETMQVVEDNFQLTFATWQEHHPKVTHERSRFRRIVTVTDDIYFYVNFGTKVRYAVMENPFYAKTSPGVLNAGSGVGKMAFIGKKDMGPIKARNFDMLIAKIALDDLTARLVKAAL